MQLLNSCLLFLTIALLSDRMQPAAVGEFLAEFLKCLSGALLVFFQLVSAKTGSFIFLSVKLGLVRLGNLVEFD